MILTLRFKDVVTTPIVPSHLYPDGLNEQHFIFFFNSYV